MQPIIMTRKRILICAAIVVGVILIIVLSIVLKGDPKNQFGNIIKIQNYSEKVKNLSPDMRDAMESYLYNIVEKNSNGTIDPSKVTDAYIRKDSDSQIHSQSINLYSGDFIIDIESIKQSYQTQYSYSDDAANTNVGGNPVVISCIPVEQLKYNDFGCTDFVTEQAGSNDTILQYLPYENFSYRITPDETQTDKLVLNVSFTIPDSDLKGDLASKQAVLALYKKQVNDWIVSKGDDPEKYTFTYNYDDNVNLIPETTQFGG